MKTLNGINLANSNQAYVHPCVINQQPHIVYPRGLKEHSPGLFNQLCQYYQQKGYRLKEDQRSHTVSNKYKNQRRKWAPIILFSASLLFESSAFADSEKEQNDGLPYSQQANIELQLISTNIIPKKILYSKTPMAKPRPRSNLISGQAKLIFSILSSRYKPRDTDPEYIVTDLKEMANYYSGFPQAVRLLESLKDKNWSLSFNEKEWLTTATGSALQVDSAVVHFNTRSAAQLRLNNGCKGNPVCIASPADALLHELLHVQSMLVTGGSFVEKGGMNNMLYPYQHEYAVIDAERKLYAGMSTYDKVRRPQRHEHSGRLVQAACATCIK